MKKLLLAVWLICLLLVTALPGMALADGKGKPVDFTVTIQIYEIESGTVTPIPPSASDVENIRWLVRDRPIYGIVSGDTYGTVAIVYDANVDLTQQGNIHGQFVIDAVIPGDGNDIISGIINGKSTPGELSPPSPLTPDFLSQFPPYLQAYLLSLEGFDLFCVLPVQGNGNFAIQGGTGSYAGVQGTGKFAGVMANTVIGITPDWTSHVVAVAPSSLLLTGRWHQ
jgi:hypothetical protein